MDSARAAPEKARRSSQTEAEDEQRGRSARTPEYKKHRRDIDKPLGYTREAPLPYDDEPPLPDEAPPSHSANAPPEDDGWEFLYDAYTNSYSFYNRFTHVTQKENPRVPEANAYVNGSYDRYAVNAAPGTSNTAGAPGAAPGTVVTSGAPGTSAPPKRPAGGYNPAIHGNYDPNADYAIEARRQEEEEEAAASAAAAVAAGLPDPTQGYVNTATFNRSTGHYQHSGINANNHSDEAKSHRQLNAFFDVDAAANSHDGRSLKAERRAKSLSKKEVQTFNRRRRERKEEKRRAWLME